MNDIKAAWRALVAEALASCMNAKGLAGEPVSADAVIVEIPPKPELGDLGFPMFQYAKIFRSSPPAIAKAVAAALGGMAGAAALGRATAEGPYVNVLLDRVSVAAATLEAVQATGSAYGKTDNLAGRRIMVEFSCPNTNKPLHLGHLRNNALGESVSRILKANGAEVRKVNLINDRGVHICKSMLAYMKLGNGATPESAGMKSDHFVGHYYVRYGELADGAAGGESDAQELLRKWESGDPETLELWKRMNDWAVSGIETTYRRTGISFDDVYYESKTYQAGKDEVLAGLERGLFYRDGDGAVWVDLEDIGLDKKVLLRKDGTSIYITQDIGTAIKRHADWPFDRLVYVVASEQQYHFRVLFAVLERLGNAWAKDLHHLSYGLVNLPEGRMKTREGTVVDADALLDELIAMARDEIAAKGREDIIEDPDAVAEKVALGALHFYLLHATPAKDMLFNPKESLSFNGATGPYIQYMGARISSMIAKDASGEGKARSGAVKPGLLAADAEWVLVRRVATFPDIVAQAGAECNPAVIAGFLYDLAGEFSTYYHGNPILTAQDPDTSATRLALATAVGRILRNGCELVCIPFLEAM
ncbi:MAG: arginine--tRNA ligase [Spirochaetes bacterium]|nr:arginine--tRNA ligase [Spirochaetota bacterium]